VNKLLLPFLSALALGQGSPSARAAMSLADVRTVLAQAATRAAALSTNSVIAVVDREGFVLGVWSVNGTTPSALDALDAITKAGTAAFLSSDQNAFPTRTAGFIVQQHFPPGIRNRPPGPLVGVNFSNLSFSDVSRFKNPQTYDAGAYGGGGTNGAPVAPLALASLSGLAGSPGGVPLYRNGRLLGGVGVAGTSRCGAGSSPPCLPAIHDIQVVQKRDIDEDVALAGQKGFAPAVGIRGSGVWIDGIRVPYVNSSTVLNAVHPLGTVGTNVPGYALTNSPAVNYPTTNLGGVAGELRAPITNDPVAGPINGEPRLTAGEVTTILAAAARRAGTTRAGIRLPRGQPARVFISVVNNPDTPGVAPTVLGTFRTPDATLFSWDVSVQKARTAIFFSRTNLPFLGRAVACSARTAGFLAQQFYPPGIAGTSPGPLYGLQERFSLLPVGITNPLNKVFLTSPATLEPSLPNGLTIFPGGFPLYRHGVLVGAIGVSGDGVDQDDLVAAAGTVDFLPPPQIRADQFQWRGTRLPYAKFPRNPEL